MSASPASGLVKMAADARVARSARASHCSRIRCAAGGDAARREARRWSGRPCWLVADRRTRRSGFLTRLPGRWPMLWPMADVVAKGGV
eukprot:3495887-Prymnesium_polylepis.1